MTTKNILPSSLASPELMSCIFDNFKLDTDSIHGPAHWARVRANGKMLCEAHGGDWQVVELFAFLHDSQRFNDHADPDHGPRAAEFTHQLCGDLFHLSNVQLATLTQACRGHTSGHLSDNLSVQICWDSDRLDLFRVGIEPDPYYLGTNLAKMPYTIAYCMARSTGHPSNQMRKPSL